MHSFVELLSPAKDLNIGIVAINHGADAVYIGGPSFGARASAGNSLSDIEKLCKYAHRFNGRIFVALNTILDDRELEQAKLIIDSLYNVGVDALIVQDMGIMQLDLPPIALHASTQADNRSLEKVRFLHDVGFSRVVLARELSLKEISTIHQGCEIDLEAFVHGALCVSYSGQCYMSQVSCGRSANRGVCAQYCRLPYSLYDAQGTLITKNKHLLSLKDMDRSDYLAEMIDAGISSFKIEGRLKDENYVKNVTSYYRQKLDLILGTDQYQHYQHSSVGKQSFFFTPNPSKTFHRGKTDYFLHGEDRGVALPTSKSIGEYIGKVLRLDYNAVVIDTQTPIHNGDGLCFFTKSGEFKGFRINQAEPTNGYYRLSLSKSDNIEGLEKGVEIYRNFDNEFERILSGKTAERKIALNVFFDEIDNGFSLRLQTEHGASIDYTINTVKQPAKKAEMAMSQLKDQLSKFGGTDFYAKDININLSQAYFFPMSTLSSWRRTALEKLESVMEERWELIKDSFETRTLPTNTAIYPSKEPYLSYLGNVMNQKAIDFYYKHGVTTVDYALEKDNISYINTPKLKSDIKLMFCKHCIKRSLGLCSKLGHNQYKEPFVLKNDRCEYRLHFDCSKCEMIISTI